MPQRIWFPLPDAVSLETRAPLESAGVPAHAVQRAGYSVDSLPELRKDGLKRAVTVGRLLNHTSGIADYKPALFPSLDENSPASIDRSRFRQFDPRALARLGLEQPSTGEPTKEAAYSHTNYVIAGLLLESVTGTDARSYINKHVIRAAKLHDTTFPDSPVIRGPHSRMYNYSQYSLIDPPKDYSVYNMSYFWTAGAIISTMDDVDRFYGALLGGKLIGPAELREMLRTVPIVDEKGEVYGRYALSIYPIQLSCGAFWGHNGSAWGAGTTAYATVGGKRQTATESTQRFTLEAAVLGAHSSAGPTRNHEAGPEQPEAASAADALARAPSTQLRPPWGRLGRPSLCDGLPSRGRRGHPWTVASFRARAEARGPARTVIRARAASGRQPGEADPARAGSRTRRGPLNRHQAK
ncbi:serine hydrolase domain-containing protein [Streptomyces sp. PU-14G]|uniref:serine hydrolase domain-containing protein n=1 Tax=Streptomyces sp. PU-14G TaxID=2800808 RepID=UPI0034DEEB34